MTDAKDRLAEALRYFVTHSNEIFDRVDVLYDEIQSRKLKNAVGKARRELAAHDAQRAESGAGVPDIETMVTRFLGWRLPDDFSPDNGISYTPITRMPGWTHDTHPIGTNLFTSDQAKAMFEYVLAAAPEKDHER